MIWNVFYHNTNSRNIEIFNIFDHSSFRNSVNKLKEVKELGIGKPEFEEALRRIVMYYFWSKYEYEVVVTSFPPYINKQELERLNSEYEKHGRLDVRLDTRSKIDIYTQIRLNWSVFVNYVWEAYK